MIRHVSAIGAIGIAIASINQPDVAMAHSKDLVALVCV
jgi:hypothetical protein